MSFGANTPSSRTLSPFAPRSKDPGTRMPAGAGLRAGTRHQFARAFRHKGFIPLTTYLRNFKIGDYVDIKVNGAVHKVGAEVEEAEDGGGCGVTARCST